MVNEAKFKSQLVDDLKRAGHYARRIEDQFLVGFPDMIVVLKTVPHVFFVEAKLVKYGKFGPTPRQHLELQRISISPAAVPLWLGFDPASGVTYLHDHRVREPIKSPKMGEYHIEIGDCSHSSPGEKPVDFFTRFINER